jgi:thiol-disulfide isomerase/thioredoxin
MNDIIPETGKPQKPKARALWKIVALVAILSAGFLYGVLNLLPNPLVGSDIRTLKTGQMTPLQILPNAPAQPIEAFEGPDGSQITLSSFKGKVILVNLWATWCAPCVTEMPTLARLQNEFKGADFKVVAVSVDRADEKAEAKSRLQELSKGTLPFYHDPRMAIVYPMQARGFPTSVLYDRQGREVARLAGEADWGSAEAQALIKFALSRN